MTALEDLLRAATRDEAAQVRPGTIPPLDPAALPRPRRSRHSRWRLAGPLSPVLAAVAVAAIAAATVLVSSGAPPAPNLSRPPARPGSVRPAGVDGAPPYYVALTVTGSPAADHPADLTVRSTATGRVLATVAAPRPDGTFTLIEGTADDRTFLVGAQVWHPVYALDGMQVSNLAQPVRLFLLHFDPGSDPGADRVWLTALPVPEFSAQYLRSAAISPDGTRLALGIQDQSGIAIRVYALPGGAWRSWSPPPSQDWPYDSAFGPRDPGATAWAANDQVLSFAWEFSPRPGVYLLDTGSAGTGSGTLLSGSRYLSRLASVWDDSSRSPFTCVSDPVLTANGAYLVCGGFLYPYVPYPNHVSPAATVTLGFAEFSAATGKLVRIVGARRGMMPFVVSDDTYFPPPTGTQAAALPDVLWSSPDGKVLVGTLNRQAFVIAGGHAFRIAWPAGVTAPEDSSFPGVAW